MPDLARLGWDSARAAEWAAANRGSDLPGRVALEHNHVYRVLTAEGEVLAEATGRLKYQAEGRHELPAVGDWVAVRVAAPGQRSQIRALLPRRSAFTRMAAGRETAEQVIAANIDVVFIVFGLDAPLKLRAIERYLVVARRCGATPVVVLNKSDLHDDVAGAVAEATVSAGDVTVHATSAKGEGRLDALEQYLTEGRTVALLGPSGAGKSSLVNRLVGRELLPTGDVREWDARGRHTSVHRQLVMRAEGGLVIDTPGMRELQLWDTEDVNETFADIAALAESCRFRDCRHDAEPGCAVKQAVEDGTLDAARYDHFVRLTREQAATEARREERAQLEEKRQAKTTQRAIRSFYKQRGH
jgi:ribosome biogenesis GTPase / thiamine phosphate phosphatase